MPKKRIRALLAGLEEQGAVIVRIRDGWQVRCPNGGIITVHGSPSDRRAEMNLRSEVRKRGMRWPFDSDN